MRPEAFPSPLTVWVGSARYTFRPGRDVAVGRDSRADIPLEDPTHNEWTSRIHLLLRFDGNRWIAIDTSRNGIYVEGERVPTVNIRDGQTITVGDPQDGQRLLFRVGAPVAEMSHPPDTGSRRGPARPPLHPPPSPPASVPLPPFPPGVPDPRPTQQSWRKRIRRAAAPAPATSPPHAPAQQGPSQFPTGPIPIPSPPAVQPSVQPAAVEPPAVQPDSGRPDDLSEPRTEPLPTPQHHALPATPAPPVAPQPLESRPPEAPLESRPPEAPLPSLPPPVPPPLPAAPPEAAQQQDRPGRVSSAIQRLRPRRAGPRPHEEVMTGPLAVAPAAPPQALPGTRGLRAQYLNVAIDGHQILNEVSFSASPGTLTAIIGPAGFRSYHADQHPRREEATQLGRRHSGRPRRQRRARGDAGTHRAGAPPRCTAPPAHHRASPRLHRPIAAAARYLRRGPPSRGGLRDL